MSTTPSPDAADPVPMSDGKGNGGLVPAERVDAATQGGFKPAVKMIDPDGNEGWVQKERVNAARQTDHMVHPDFGKKMVTPDGKVTYALPEEVKQFKASGHTLINPDGSFDLQNIPGEDPLKEVERREKVYKALSPAEAAGARKAEIKDFAKTGVNATIATASGVAGAGALGSVGEMGIAGLSKLAPTAARALGSKWLLKVLGVAGGVGSGVAGNAVYDMIKRK